MKNASIIILFFVLFVQSTYALIQIKVPHQIETQKRTHIIVTGKGSEQGYQFQQVALGMIAKIKEIYPEDQIYFLTAQENSSNVEMLQSWGMTVTNSNSQKLSDEKLLELISPFQRIASLHIIGHNAPHLGTALENKSYRFGTKTSNLERLRNHFTDDAFVTLQGCNTGFTLGTFLSQKLRIPVAAAFTSTEFQRLHNNGHFYINDPGHYPEGGWAATNAVSLQKPYACPSGACLRLKPHWIPYSGAWGTFGDAGGLGYYKFFCREVSEETCLRAMYKSTLISVSDINLGPRPNLQQYKNYLNDLFCPNDRSGMLRSDCIQKINQSLLKNDLTYDPFHGQTLQCDFNQCKMDIKCSSFRLIFRSGCQITNYASGPTTTMMDEYLTYLKAYHLFSGL
ncbi:MAG: hypothetical protein BroJett040_20910 [Oligoflexia bacterium]|nr:MAG: hypothetical protein BroJett040_20910 [Oligoflexia bacterium]